LDSVVNAKRVILDQKQRAKEDFMSTSGVVDPGLEGSNKLGQISNLENQLIEERGLAKDASYRVEQLDQLIARAKNNGLSSIEAPTTITHAGSGGTSAPD